MNFYIILWSLAIAIGANLLFFIIAFIIKTDVFTDITYAATFTVISLVVVIWKQNFSPTQITIFILYNLWALRTGGYLFTRIMKTKVDHRFDKMRDSFLKFGSFWVLQGLSVFIISLPAIFALSLNTSYFSASFNFYTLILIVPACLFMAIETIADFQKFAFYNSKTSDKQILNYGMWQDSRHPNYFGEIGFWYMLFGIFLCDLWVNNLSQSNTNVILCVMFILSPLYLNLLLVNISGIPLLEKSAYKKQADNPDYQVYIKKTSCLIPYIGKKGHIRAVKKLDSSNKAAN